jgi:hypothetical protein
VPVPSDWFVKVESLLKVQIAVPFMPQVPIKVPEAGFVQETRSKHSNVATAMNRFKSTSNRTIAAN